MKVIWELGCIGPPFSRNDGDDWGGDGAIYPPPYVIDYQMFYNDANFCHDSFQFILNKNTQRIDLTTSDEC